MFGIVLLSGWVAWVNIREPTPALAYRNWLDVLRVGTGLHHFIGFPCQIRWTEGEYSFARSIPADECYRMTPRQAMRGVWIRSYEGSEYWPGARSASELEPAPGGIWLDIEGLGLRDRFPPPEWEELRAFEVVFEGRQTLYAGAYGHLGGSDHHVIVDRFISVRPIDPGPYRRRLDAYMAQFRQ
jgi:hypothetical protein